MAATPEVEVRVGVASADQKPMARARITPTHRLVAATRNCWNNLCFWCCDTADFSWTPYGVGNPERALFSLQRQVFQDRFGKFSRPQGP